MNTVALNVLTADRDSAWDQDESLQTTAGVTSPEWSPDGPFVPEWAREAAHALILEAITPHPDEPTTASRDADSND